MLFNGFSIEGKGNVGGNPWEGHPFNPSDNIHGIDGGGSHGIHTLANPAVTARQEAYVRKVIDTVNDLDNVVLNDTDHSYFWIGFKADGLAAQRAWVWENFTRSNQLDPEGRAGRSPFSR